MSEAELREGAKQFFTNNKVGTELKRRWDQRVAEMTRQLIYETDQGKLVNLQAKIQYHKDVLQTDIGL